MTAGGSERGAMHIVITSIYPPTRAVARLCADKRHRVIVVGDRKTPADWRHEGATFISADQQSQLDFRLAKSLPWNHYCRKMLGYLAAIRDGASVVVDVDDDN